MDKLTLSGFKPLTIQQLKQGVAASALMLLLACEDSSDLEREKELYADYTIPQITALIDETEYDEAINAVNYFRDVDRATVEHLLLLTRAYIETGDGTAAETVLKRIESRGTPKEVIALRKAQALMLVGDTDEAEEILASTDLPANDLFDAYLIRGDIAVGDNKIEAAKAFYADAIAADPDNFKGYTAQAILSLQLGNLDEAKTYVAQAAERVEDDTIVSYAQGMVARSEGNIEAAITHFEKAIALNETNILSRFELVGIHLTEGNVEAAQSQLDEIYQRSPNNAFANYYTALMLAEEGKLDEAEDILIRTPDFTRGYAPSARALGLVSYELKKYVTAIPYLERALRVFPNDTISRLALADSYNQRSQSRKALEVLKPIVDEGNSVDGLVQAAAAAGGFGDVSAARDYMEKALELAKANGDDPELLLSVQQRTAFARFLNNDLQGATELLDDLHEQNAEDTTNLLHQANMRMLSGDLAGAEALVDRIARDDSDNIEAANLSGAILHRKGQLEEAVAAYTVAIDKKPDYQSALKNRAITYLKLREFEKARDDLETAVKLAPNEPQLAAMYGRALLETGNAEQSIPYFEQATRSLPNSPIIAADHSEALAELGYYSSALTLARKARSLAPNNNDFVAYMNEKTSLWEQAKVESEASAKEERQQEFAEIDAERAKQRELIEELKENSVLTEEGDDQNEKVLAELRALAEANRKADEEERRAREARAAAEAKLNAEKDEATEQTAEEAAAEKARLEAEQNRILARNRLFGTWLATELGLSGGDAEGYVLSVIDADKSEPGDTDLVRKALLDLEEAGKGKTIQAIQKKLDEFKAQAAKDTDK